MRPTIRVGGKIYKQRSHSLGLKRRFQTAAKACWKAVLWVEVIIWSIRHYERKGQLAPLEQQMATAQRAMPESLTPMGEQREKQRQLDMSEKWKANRKGMKITKLYKSTPLCWVPAFYYLLEWGIFIWRFSLQFVLLICFENQNIIKGSFSEKKMFSLC